MINSGHPSPDEEVQEAGFNPAMHLSWEEIVKARADEKLQRRGWKRFKPEVEVPARACPGCGRPGEGLAWIYFTNEPDCWMSECGLEGWIVACMECRKQADFFPTLMS